MDLVYNADMSCADKTRHYVHRIDWLKSMSMQLETRKNIEQTPFEDICSFACSMFDRIDLCKTENIQLNLQLKQLQHQFAVIQQTLLTGGSNAAKNALSKLQSTAIADDSSDITTNPGIENASLLVEKSQLEKKVLELQEKLTDVLNSKSEAVQKLVDLKNELDEKEHSNRQLKSLIAEKDREIISLRETLVKLDEQNKTITDEYLANNLSYSSLEKRHLSLQIDYDNLRQQLLALKREDADRLNAENDKIMKLQNERIRLGIEAGVAGLNQLQLSKQSNRNLEDNADPQSALLSGHNKPARIPDGIESVFDAHDSETCAVHWFRCQGSKDDILATGGSDRKLKLWKVQGLIDKPITVLLGNNASITSIDVESNAILASSNDQATRIWSISNYTARQTLTGHSDRVLSAKFLGVPNEVASGSQDRTLKIWDINQGSCVKTYFAGSSCYDLVFSNPIVISGHFDGKIRCWDRRCNECVSQLALPSKITSLDISKDGFKLLSSLRDNTIKCIDWRNLEVIKTFSDEKFKIGGEFCRAKFSHDAQYLSCGTSYGAIYIWDFNSAKVEKILSSQSNGYVIASTWSPDGERMISIERGKKVTVWR